MLLQTVGISQFVDVCHMIQKCNAHSLRNGGTLEAKESMTLKLLGAEQAELKWFCSSKDNTNLYEDYLRRRVTEFSTFCLYIFFTL